MASLMRVNLNKNKRYLQTLGPIGRHVKGERNLHPYASLNNQQTAKNTRDSQKPLNLIAPILRSRKAVTVKPMK